MDPVLLKGTGIAGLSMLVWGGVHLWQVHQRGEEEVRHTIIGSFLVLLALAALPTFVGAFWMPEMFIGKHGPSFAPAYLTQWGSIGAGVLLIGDSVYNLLVRAADRREQRLLEEEEQERAKLKRRVEYERKREAVG